MNAEPQILFGHRAIAGHLGFSTRKVQHLFSQRLAPIWREGGCPVATVAGLDDWLQAAGANRLAQPTNSERTEL